MNKKTFDNYMIPLIPLFISIIIGALAVIVVMLTVAKVTKIKKQQIDKETCIQIIRPEYQKKLCQEQ